jgi:hypothetical protein
VNYKEILDKRAKDLQLSLENLKDSAKPVDLGQSIGRLTRMDAITHHLKPIFRLQILNDPPA